MTDRHTTDAAGDDTPGRPAPRFLDWRRAKISDPMQPCVICRRPALLRDPDSNRPMHKVCAESALEQGRL